MTKLLPDKNVKQFLAEKGEICPHCLFPHRTKRQAKLWGKKSTGWLHEDDPLREINTPGKIERKMQCFHCGRLYMVRLQAVAVKVVGRKWQK